MALTLTDEQEAAIRAEIVAGRQARQIAERATKIWNDPKTSERAKALWKEGFPDEPIEGYDLEQRVNARFAAEKAEREAEAKRQADAELESKITSGRSRAKERGYTDDAIQRMEQMMVDRGIRDYDDAMDLMAAREPRPAEETGGAAEHFWRHDQQDAFKQVAADPEKWAFGEIQKAVSADARARGIR